MVLAENIEIPFVAFSLSRVACNRSDEAGEKYWLCRAVVDAVDSSRGDRPI